MSVTEVLGGLGSWELTLVDNTPDEIMAQLGYFGHVAIVDGPVDVAASGNSILSGARYVGVCRGKPSRFSRDGEGLLFWLSDEDGKGWYIETAITLTNVTLSAAITALLPPSVTLGTVNTQPDPAQRYTGTHQFQSRREALGIVCDTFGVELRVNGNFTVDVGTAAQLYNTSLPLTSKPSPLIVRKGAGSDIDLTAIAGQVATEGSARDYSTRIVVLGQTVGSGDQPDTVFATGSVNAPSVPYKDPQGAAVKLTRVISQPSETDTSAAVVAALNLNRFNRTTTAVKVTADDYDIDGTMRVGDAAYVYDPDSGILDTANQVIFHGEVLHPQIVRVSADTWPILDGYTVAWRTDAGTWIDLTPWVVWETGDSDELTVGDLPKTLTRSGDNTVTDRVDAARPSTKIPKAPTGLSLATSSAINPKGTDSAIITATWSAVTQNTDNTAATITGYQVQYRPTFRAPTWTASAASDGLTVDLPVVAALAYDVQVRAVSSSGKFSAWTSTASITSAADSTAPGTPSDPVVTNYLGLLRIYWDGKNNVGGAMPADFNRVDVHVGTTAGFTASATTLTDSLSVAGYSHVSAPYGSTRYVRLIAYDHNGNASASSATMSGATVQAGDGDIAALNVGKLTAGIMSADVTISGRFATALTGARVELNSLGLQKWDASNTLLVSITGTTNLLTGTFKTAATGRRIEIGSAGAAGEINAYAPDGTQATFRAFTEGTGLEAVQFGLVVTGANNLWNRINYNTDEWSNYRANRQDFYVGSSTGFFVVRHTGDKGVTSAGTLAKFAASDAQITTTGNVTIQSEDKVEFQVGSTGSLLSVRMGAAIQDQGVHLVQMTPLISGARYGGGFLYIQDSPGVNTRLGALWFDRSSYMPLVASAFTVSSSEDVKENIRPFQGSALDILAGTKPVSYRRRRPRAARSEMVTDADGEQHEVLHPDGPQLPDGPEEIGFIAEQSPVEIRSEAGDGIELYALATLNTAAINELRAMVTQLQRAGQP